MHYRLFVGSNNETHQVETAKLQAFLNRFFDGYTITDSVGYWKGQREVSVIVDITADPTKLVVPGHYKGPNEGNMHALVRELAEHLEQQAIGMQTLPEVVFIG